jgi:SAM-dependent methyltransferase
MGRLLNGRGNQKTCLAAYGRIPARSQRQDWQRTLRVKKTGCSPSSFLSMEGFLFLGNTSLSQASSWVCPSETTLMPLNYQRIARLRLRMMDALIPSRWRFEWRYWRGQTPWDTRITPPEVMEFIAGHAPGRALDLGCGTGTNAITLACHGWQVTGVDFAPKAIRQARRKTAAAGLEIEFHAADVTNLGMLTGPYDYVLDIGCLFTLKENDRINYARELARLMRSEGEYMLYAWLPRPWKGGFRGISADAVESLLHAAFIRTRFVIGEEKGSPSAWYWYRRGRSIAAG